MKRLNEYFLNSCIIFTVCMIYSVIIHEVMGPDTIQISSIERVIMITILSQLAMFMTDNMRIFSGVVHIIVELILMEVLTLGLSVPLGLMESIEGIIHAAILVAIIEIVTTFSYFIRTQKDAAFINRKLKERDEKSCIL